MTQTLSYNRKGDRILLNGHPFSVPWIQKNIEGEIQTFISDISLMQTWGFELLSTTNFSQQPIQWFTLKDPTLNAEIQGNYRYLEITKFAEENQWELSVNNGVLNVKIPPSTVTNIRQEKPEWGDRIVVNLDRPTPWRLSFIPTTTVKRDDPVKPDDPTQIIKPNGQEWNVFLESQLSPNFTPENFTPSPQLQSLNITPSGTQTVLKIKIPPGGKPQISTLTNPPRLIIDIRPDFFREKNISWMNGLSWHQRYIKLNQDSFPVTWLEVDPRQTNFSIKPFLSNPSGHMEGTASLLNIVKKLPIIAAINGGFFNRKNKLPLSVIRQDNIWRSSPILNRGVIAWNDAGDLMISRLILQETIRTENGKFLPIIYPNSAYIQGGISRYTPAWGNHYIPLSDQEIIVTIIDDQIISHTPGGKAGENRFIIPPNGYLLTLRSLTEALNQLPIGSRITIESQTIPPELNHYPHIIGGGPVLVKNGEISLNPQAENFSNIYIKQTAIRSAIAQTKEGNLLMIVVYNRVGGSGPTFAELAQILQTMGVLDAVNLDGGSSTSLYLGGGLLDRPPETAARIHHGLGIFVKD